MNETADSPANDWDELVEVGRYPTLAQAHEHGLVILAMREACCVTEGERASEYALHAEPEAAAAISRELSAYDNEQAKADPPPANAHDVFRYQPGWGVYGVWAASLLLAAFWQGEDPTLVSRAASSSTGFIGHGQWWRPFTSLFLHADPPHLVGNLLSGLLFGTLVARSIGALRGWLLILACGTIGNAITSALTWPDSFESIGASTAVFGALGILTGLGFATMLRARFRLPWVKITAPLLAGIVLLGWLGGGSPGGNTDVLGHVFGFSSGLTAGLVIGAFNPHAPNPVPPVA